MGKAKKPEQAGRPKKASAKAAKRRQKEDSEDIERAVYDGMQDLRVKKTGAAYSSR